MADHLVMTVGTNPLPVVVAIHRLLALYPGAALTLVESAETHEQSEAIFDCLKRKLNFASRPVNWKTIRVENAGSPQSIHETVGRLSRAHEHENVHLHYTGGTKTMGLQSYKALSDPAFSISLGDSYLDPRDRKIIDGNGTVLTPGQVEEEIYDWNLTVDELAHLHGYTTSFTGDFRGSKIRFGPDCVRDVSLAPNPTHVRETLIPIAHRMRQVLSEPRFGAPYSKWLKDNWRIDDRRWPKLPDPGQCPLNGKRFPVNLDPTRQPDNAWSEIPRDLNEAFDKCCWVVTQDGQWAFDSSPLGPAQLEEVAGFLNSSWLEVSVYAILRSALKTLTIGHHVQPSTHFARTSAPHRGQFEIDVLAVLGYQLLAVSCTSSAATKEVKGKAFEVLHRARQIGGDGARCVVISMLQANEANRLEDEFHDDIGTGGDDRPLVIWSSEDLRNLPGKFTAYLTDHLRVK